MSVTGIDPVVLLLERMPVLPRDSIFAAISLTSAAAAAAVFSAAAVSSAKAAAANLSSSAVATGSICLALRANAALDFCLALRAYAALDFCHYGDFCLVLHAYAALDFCHYRRLPSTYTRAPLLLGVCGSHNLQRERAVVTGEVVRYEESYD